MSSKPEARSYTAEQHTAVKRVMKCDSTDFYSILNIKKPSHEVEIKKSYRRLALSMHPDKNSAPQADEAFKRISKAFQVLSDADKKRIYDETGCDPDVRGAASGFSTMRPQGAGMHFQANGNGPSPEDILNAFFGRGFQFSTGGAQFKGFTADFGQPRPRQRRRPQPQEPENNGWQLFGLVAIVMLLLSAMIFDGSSRSNKPAAFEFAPRPPFTSEQISQKYKIPFYVNPTEYSKLDSKKRLALGRDVERAYIVRLRHNCRIEHDEQQRAIQSAEGFFFTDRAALRRAMDMPLPNCDQLNQMNVYPNLI